MDNKSSIVYLWVKKYGIFEDFGFSLNRKYSVNVDVLENGESANIEIKKNSEYIENFFGNNINVLAVVGNNGVGKTTFLNILSEIINCLSSLVYETGFFMIFESKEKVYVFSNIECNCISFDEIEIENIAYMQEKGIMGQGYKIHKFKTFLQCSAIYHTECININEKDTNRSIVSSPFNIMKNVEESSEYNEKKFTDLYANKIIYNQLKLINFLNNKNSSNELNGAELEIKPNCVDVEIDSLDYDSLKMNREFHYNRPNAFSKDHMYYNMFDLISDKKITKWLFDTDFYILNDIIKDRNNEILLMEAIMYMYIDFPLYSSPFYTSRNNPIEKLKLLEHLLKKSSSKVQGLFRLKLICAFIRFLLKCLKNGNFGESIYVFEYMKKYYESEKIYNLFDGKGRDHCNKMELEKIILEIDASLYMYFDFEESINNEEKILHSMARVVIKSLYLKNKEIIDIYKYLSFWNTFSEKIGEASNLVSDIQLNFKLRNKDVKCISSIGAIEFLDTISGLDISLSNFAFKYGLSSGEMALLNLFSKLKETAEKCQDKNVYILLDEADMLLHPEWQRKYVSTLIKMIPLLFEKKNVNIVIATHSPIMLSDIPKQNTIFLKSENRKTFEVEGSQTFSSNIFDLYRNAFFIEESGIGSFAEKKLKYILHEIRERDNDEEGKIKNYINCIGDDFIRGKIMHEYRKKFDIMDEKDRRIAELEKELAELKKEQKND